jgi:hypothetical protein
MFLSVMAAPQFWRPNDLGMLAVALWWLHWTARLCRNGAPSHLGLAATWRLHYAARTMRASSELQITAPGKATGPTVITTDERA